MTPAMDPIILLGFGRSGTTWISDIVSKALGGLILFEPLHPSVTGDSERLSYRPVDPASEQGLRKYLDDVLGKRLRKMWLMRNHVPVRLEEIDPDFLGVLWNECAILGFKEIRCNFMLPWLVKTYGRRVIFIVRDPRSVAASILKRRNFWEFGWPGTYLHFLAGTVDNPAFAGTEVAALSDYAHHLQSDVERIAAMWAVTHAIALPQLAALEIPAYRYEDFYIDPFATTRLMLSQLGRENASLHPAHLFTPSMTTAKTVHGLFDFDKKIAARDMSFFWDATLDESDIAKIFAVTSRFGVDTDGWR
ncbi:MAG: sulfotransferase [Rhodospirillales bacterium]